MGGACGRHGGGMGNKMQTGFWWENLKERGHLPLLPLTKYTGSVIPVNWNSYFTFHIFVS
jgi:hypothetical protein